MRHPILGGVAAGVMLRLAFSGKAGSPWSAMAGTFIFLAPLLVGMLTVYWPSGNTAAPGATTWPRP